MLTKYSQDGLIYVFVAPTLYGAGDAIATMGLLIVGVSLLATIWRSAFGHSALLLASRTS